MSGTITYGNAIGSPATRFVSNVTVQSTAGSPPVSTVTGGLGPNEGQYSLTGFGAGSYTITPSKVGGQNGYVTSFDAAKIAQHVAGLVFLTGNQLIVADVSGNGMIQSFDAALIARYVVNLPGSGLSGTWKFGPVNRNYPSVNGNLTGEDYTAFLMGEVSGNWTNSGARPVNATGGPERAAVVAAPQMVTPADTEVVLPVTIQGAADKGLISYEFDLRYDPSVIQPQRNVVDLSGTVSSGLTAVANVEEPGVLKVAVYGPNPIDDSGVLLKLKFAAVGKPGSISPLIWERIMFNEGTPKTSVSNGQVELSPAAPYQAEIAGRVLTGMGQGVSNVRVTLTDAAGQSRSLISNGFGYYRFGGLQIGQTYTVTVASRANGFTPVTVSVTDQLTSVDMIARQ